MLPVYFRHPRRWDRFGRLLCIFLPVLSFPRNGAKAPLFFCPLYAEPQFSSLIYEFTNSGEHFLFAFGDERPWAYLIFFFFSTFCTCVAFFFYFFSPRPEVISGLVINGRLLFLVYCLPGRSIS